MTDIFVVATVYGGVTTTVNGPGANHFFFDFSIFGTFLVHFLVKFW